MATNFPSFSPSNPRDNIHFNTLLKKQAGSFTTVGQAIDTLLLNTLNPSELNRELQFKDVRALEFIKDCRENLVDMISVLENLEEEKLAHLLILADQYRTRQNKVNSPFKSHARKVADALSSHASMTKAEIVKLMKLITDSKKSTEKKNSRDLDGITQLKLAIYQTLESNFKAYIEMVS